MACPSQPVDVNFPPEGAWFELLPDGFSAGATTRSRIAIILAPFTFAWSWMSMYGVYGRQIVSRHFDLRASLLGLSFVFGTCFLAGWCALTVAEKQTVTRRADRLLIFVGVGGLGWTRNYVWSDFRSVREEIVSNPFNRNRRGRIIVVEGTHSIAFGSLWNEERRYFVMCAIRKMLGDMNRSQVTAITPARFRGSPA